MSPQKIGKKLKEARLKLGLKQTDVAKKADVSPNYYARIERDEENPTLETMQMILKALKVKSSDILPF
jgi:transcriptional regulator with XRE-family HTH domain